MDNKKYCKKHREFISKIHTEVRQSSMILKYDGKPDIGMLV